MTALDTVQAVLDPLGYQTYLDQVSAVQNADGSSTVPSQYVVLGSPATGRSDEEVLAGDSLGTAVDLRVTAVVGTTGGVRIMLQRIRDILSPGLRSADFAGDGLQVSTLFLRSEMVDVDTSVTITGTNRHPAYGVDTYRLITEVTA